jgi:Ca-activated chloride channel family protein
LVAARHTARFLPGFSRAKALARIACAIAAAVFLAIGLTGPVRGYTERAVQRRGLDLVVCIDTSRSMLVRDLRPDRLTRAKREVAGMVERMHGDRVALVAFAGEARDVAPLTHDRTTLRALLERVSPADNTLGGTDIGVALQHALDLFDGQSGAHEAIVVLTDGEDLGGKGLEVAKAAAARGIRVYVVGMATEAGGKIPDVRPDGSERFVVDESGKEVVSQLGGESLAQIAAATGGDFLPATRSVTPLEEIYSQRISKLEGRELAGGVERVPHDRFQWFLVLALGCMLVEAGLRERKRASVAGGVA